MKKILKKIITSFLILILILGNCLRFFSKNVLAESKQEKTEYISEDSGLNITNVDSEKIIYGFTLSNNKAIIRRCFK